MILLAFLWFHVAMSAKRRQGGKEIEFSDALQSGMIEMRSIPTVPELSGLPPGIQEAVKAALANRLSELGGHPQLLEILDALMAGARPEDAAKEFCVSQLELASLWAGVGDACLAMYEPLLIRSAALSAKHWSTRGLAQGERALKRAVDGTDLDFKMMPDILKEFKETAVALGRMTGEIAPEGGAAGPVFNVAMGQHVVALPKVAGLLPEKSIEVQAE